MPEPDALYGIIGDPLSHSLSPLMHNAAFQALRINAEYKLFPLKEEELKNFFTVLKKENSPIAGLNVTVPYKEKTVEFMDLLSPFAKKVMAVNTIVIKPNRSLEGFNTDGPGFLTHLTELKVNTAGKRIAILGAGGTARSILTVLCLLPEKPESIFIYNRHYEKAEALIRDLGLRMDASIIEPVKTIEDLNIELANILINTTSVGLKNDDPILIDESHLHSHLFVYDVIYNPAETQLLKIAKNKGAQTANGLGMLFYQGVLAFQRWTNIQLDEKIKMKMRKSLESGIKHDH